MDKQRNLSDNGELMMMNTKTRIDISGNKVDRLLSIKGGLFGKP